MLILFSCFDWSGTQETVAAGSGRARNCRHHGAQSLFAL